MSKPDDKTPAPEQEPQGKKRPMREELRIMNRLDGILSELGADKDAKARVLMWLVGTHAPPGFSAAVSYPEPDPPFDQELN